MKRVTRSSPPGRTRQQAHKTAGTARGRPACDRAPARYLHLFESKGRLTDGLFPARRGILAFMQAGKRSELPFSVELAARRIVTRERRRNEEREERRERAVAWAHHVATMLGAADSTLTMLIGFGSAFETWRAFREDSDIDIGMVGGDWSRCMRALPNSEFIVSLIELNLQNREFADHVRSEGVVLYEKRGND